MSMTEPKFGDLPGKKRGSAMDGEKTAAALRARPGEWALIASYAGKGSAGTRAGQINRAVSAVWEPRGSYQAVSRGNDVWARYVGDEVTP